MRALITCLALLTLIALSVAGLRGTPSRRSPIELFPDMVRQPRVRPQSASTAFADGLHSRQSVQGTVARGTVWADDPIQTGSEPNTTNSVELNPLPVSSDLLARGHDRYLITCLPCHGPEADGKGIATKLGLVAIANLHDPRIVRMPDGELFKTIGHGRNLMQGYGASLTQRDRWAVVAFVRALQLSKLGLLEDVPADQLPTLTNQLVARP